MSMQIIECDQGSPEWFTARMGIPTASEFAKLLGINKDAKEKKTRDLYMRKLAGEIITGLPMDRYQNEDMERGKENEDEARDLYALTAGVDPQRVGFIRNGRAGCSPDSLIGDDGGLEIKDALAHVQIERLLKGELPPEHRAQVQGNIWLAEREWWDFISHSRGLPLLKVRVPRDDNYIATLDRAVDDFNAELDAMVERIRSYDMKAAA